MIELADLERLCMEILERQTRLEPADRAMEFIERAGISEEAMREVLWSASRQFVKSGGNATDALVDIVGQTFMIGWEIRDQFGGRS